MEVYMSAGSELQLDSLVRVLRWDDTCSEVGSEWKSDYLRSLRQRFLSVAQLDPSGLLMKAADIMNTDELEILLLSPRVSWRLIRNVEPKLDTVSVVQAEMLRALDEHTEETEGGLESGCFRLAELIVDCQSSYDCPSREPGEPTLARLSPQAETQACALFEESVDLLKRRLPHAYHFVTQMTSRVVIRSDQALPNSFASGSFRDHAGLTLIVNPGVLDKDAPKLIDALVHEAVHAAIYMYEPLVSPLCRSYPNELRVQSCWSGRMLTLDQYVQACFVWWGLLNLWSAWSLVEEGDHSAQNLLERAARGFHTSPVSSLRKQIDDANLDRRTWIALSEIERLSAAILASSYSKAS
jgi:hypothetical protein